MGVENTILGRGAVPAAVRGVLRAALLLATVLTVLGTGAAVVALTLQVAYGRFAVDLVGDTPLPASVAHGHVVTGVWQQAHLVLQDVPGAVVAIGLVADSAGVVARLALGVILIVLLRAVGRRTPLTEGVALRVTIGGGVMAIGALLQIGLGVLADWMVADLLTSDGSGDWPLSSTGDSTLLVVGFGAMVVGLLLSHGAQLQHETDGLV